MSQLCQYIRSGKEMIAFKSNKEVEENRPVKPKLLGSEDSLACSAYWHDFFLSDFRLLSSFIFIFPTPLQAQNDIRHERVVWFSLFRPTRMTFAVDWNGFEYNCLQLSKCLQLSPTDCWVVVWYLMPGELRRLYQSTPNCVLTYFSLIKEENLWLLCVSSWRNLHPRWETGLPLHLS